MPPTYPRSTVGLIGLGLMGASLAQRLHAAAFDVLCWDIDAARRDSHGGSVAASASEVFASCERVLLSLPHLGVSGEVLASVSLRSGQCVIDTGTGDSRQAIDLSQRLAASGAIYLDAPISGSSAQVRAGQATMFVGGSPEAFAQSRDLFEVIARTVIYAGDAGGGMKLKLVTNLVLGLNRAALAEGLVFARSLGLEPDAAFEALRESASYSRIMDAKGPKMLSGDFAPEARLSQHLKDVRLMLASGARLPLTEAHRALLERAEALGCGALDNSAIINAFE